MEKFWSEALKATGAVSVVGWLLWFLLQRLFSEQIVGIFSSEQIFAISFFALCALLLILALAVRWHFLKKEPSSVSSNGAVANVSGSTIGGDFVMGDKIENKDSAK